MKYFSLLLLSIGALAFIVPERRSISIFLAGDSTISIKEPKAYPETGWGMPFVQFWDSTVTVLNYGKNGRSTKTFISEGLWQRITEQLKPGDYVIIQFGHNDESVEKKERYTTPDSFKLNLTKFVQETRRKAAIPILLSPVSRRKFDSEGVALSTHIVYTPLVKEVAIQERALYFDLDSASRKLYQQLGPLQSSLLFLHLKAGEHPNYPMGKEDNTHFNELGARLVAQVVLKGICSLAPDLQQFLVKPSLKK